MMGSIRLKKQKKLLLLTKVFNNETNMKSFELDNYSNFLDYLKFSNQDIEEKIKTYSLNFISVKDPEVEYKIKFPPFLIPFYGFIYLKNNIPNQEDFYEYYMSENYEFFNEKKFTDKILYGLKARLYRTYPSLIRDVHFLTFINENLSTHNVLYNTKLDMVEGIDLMISSPSGLYYAINLYTNTRLSLMNRRKKMYRHTKFENVNYIELPVNFNGSNKCGDFYLYGTNELELIKSNF
jgi:hypothetical protein